MNQVMACMQCPPWVALGAMGLVSRPAPEHLAAVPSGPDPLTALLPSYAHAALAGACARLDIIAALPLLETLALRGWGRDDDKAPHPELTSWRRLSALTQLSTLYIDFSDGPRHDLELCRVGASWPALRELNLPDVIVDGAALAALAASPITNLCGSLAGPPPAAYAQAPPPMQQQGVPPPQQHGQAATATLTGGGGGRTPLPLHLRELRLDGTLCAASLAALLPAPPSLEIVEMESTAPTVYLQPWVPGDEEQHAARNTCLHPSAAAYMAGAVAFLAGRTSDTWAGPNATFTISAWDMSDRVQPWTGVLQGPHACWLRHLAPLDGDVIDLQLAMLSLSNMDLAALVTAMPGLQVREHACVRTSKGMGMGMGRAVASGCVDARPPLPCMV